MQSNKLKSNNLYESLERLSDHRRPQGRMHDLRLTITIVIMATMSGCQGLRSIGDFINKNRKELVKAFKPRNDKLPSYLTVGRILQNVDYEQLSKIFRNWAINHVQINKNDWLSIDGKAIGGTVNRFSGHKQSFLSMVSVFASENKQVLHAGLINNSKESEIPKVKDLIKVLGLENVVYTLDALHCQKQTTKAIIDSNNNYCIGVKGNQKTLHNQIKKIYPPSSQKILMQARKKARTV